MAATNYSKVRVKLLIDPKSNKVLFAEGGKDFVDFLFNLFASTVVEHLTKNSLKGSIGNLYESVKNHNAFASDFPRLLAYGESSSSTRKAVYACGNMSHRNYVSDDPSLACPHCSQNMSTEIPFVDLTTAAKGKSDDDIQAAYMVMDDLAVKPMSTISCISILNKYNVQDVGALEEKVVDVGIHEGWKLLKFSLQSKTVLTNVFLGNRR